MTMLRTALLLLAAASTSAFHAPTSIARSSAVARATTPVAGPFDFLAFGQAGASHILLKDSMRAQYLKKEIEDGKTSFAAVAKEFSTCPSGAKGGDLGTFARGAMVPEFDAYCYDPNTKVGELGIVRTQFGTHIVKLTKKP